MSTTRGEALRNIGAGEQQLKTWRKGHPFKVQLADRLGAETTMSVSWIAERLNLGTRGHLAVLLSQLENSCKNSSSMRMTQADFRF
jgi:hypothetical protein